MSDITPRQLSPPLLPMSRPEIRSTVSTTGLIELPVICCKSQRDLHEMERSRWPLLLLEAAASSLILELDLALHVYGHPRASSRNKRLQEVLLDALLHRKTIFTNWSARDVRFSREAACLLQRAHHPPGTCR